MNFMAEADRFGCSTRRGKLSETPPCRSPRELSCGTSQGETVDVIRRVGAARRRSAKVISAVGAVAVPLYLLRRNENVLPVLSAPCVDFPVYVPDVGRVAVRVVATAKVRFVGH